MSRLILRKTDAAAISSAQAEALVCATGCGRVVHRDGNNLLVDLDNVALDALKLALAGWVVAEQGARIEVPNPQLKLLS